MQAVSTQEEMGKLMSGNNQGEPFKTSVFGGYYNDDDNAPVFSPPILSSCSV